MNYLSSGKFKTIYSLDPSNDGQILTIGHPVCILNFFQNFTRSTSRNGQMSQGAAAGPACLKMAAHGNGHFSFRGNRKDIGTRYGKRNRFRSLGACKKKFIWFSIPACSINNRVAIGREARRPDVSQLIRKALKLKTAHSND